MPISRVRSVFLATLLISTNVFGVRFSPHVYDTGGVNSIVCADINRDGFLDLIVANPYFSQPYIAVLLGGPNGTFIEQPGTPTKAKPVSLAAGDFDHDGYPDVVVLEATSFELFTSAHNGVLVSQSTRTIGGDAKEIVALDLNGDHIPDLALTYCNTAQCELDTFLNDGSGHFTLAQERDFTGPNYDHGLVASDFDRDGHEDLAISDGTNVRILHSNNNGTLNLKQTLNVAGNIAEFGLAAGDIDATHGPDLVFQATDSCADTCLFHSSAYIYLNDGSGVLVRKSHVDMGANAGSSNMLTDITGDNRLDLVHLRPPVQESSGSIQYALNVGSGKFGALTNTEYVVGAVQHFLARDLNFDSRHDIAFADDNTALPGTWTYLNTSATTICAPPNSSALAAKMCFPSSSTSTTRTFVIRGSGNSPTGVRRVELWIDGKKLYDSPDDQLKRTVTLTAGTHRIVIQAVDQFGATSKVVRNVTVP